MAIKSKIIELSVDDSGIIDYVRVNGDEGYWPYGGATPMDPVDHEALAEEISRKGLPTLSVLVYASWMAEDLYDDPKHAEKSVVVTCSVVEEMARSRIKSFFSVAEDFENIAKEVGIDLAGAVETSLREGRNPSLVKDKIFDGIYRAKALSIYPEIIAELRSEYRLYDPESGKKRDKALTRTELNDLWKKELTRILSPRTEVRYRRISPLPDPISGLCNWQQYYLAKRGDEVIVAEGNSSGSATRYAQGRFAHAFATLDESGYPGLEGTLVIHIGKDNRARLVRAYPQFKASYLELTGNYGADRDKAKKLFSGRLLSFDDEAQQLTEF